MSLTASTAPVPAGLREQKKQDKLRRIIAAARDLFETQGFEGTTGRDICRRAGIGTGTLFLYVRDKRELLFWMFREDTEALLKRDSRRSDHGVVGAWMEFLGGFIDLYAKQPALSRLFVRELFFRREDGTGMRALSQQLSARLEALAQEAQSRGELRADVAPGQVRNAVLAHYAFWIQAWLGMGVADETDVKPGLRRALELQVEGLRGDVAS